MSDNFGAGPAYGNWDGDPGHEGAARPMESLKGNMGPVFEQPPMSSEAMTGGRVGGTDTAPGPAWDDTFRAPLPAGTRGSGF